MNRETETGVNYHDQTKHSYWSVRNTPHYLDWDNKPSPFKVYPALDAITLPRELSPSGVSTLAALERKIEPGTSGALSLESIASILFYSAGVTKTKSFAGGSIYFRAAACAGALYPIEVYLACGDINGLKSGVYHFNPGDFSLRMLREGDYRDVLGSAAEYDLVTRAPLTLIYTAISWRSTWKYRDRAYRYHYWDSGTILAHAMAMATAHGAPSEVVLGFIDSEVNKLIGVDGSNEFALALLSIGQSDVEPVREQTFLAKTQGTQRETSDGPDESHGSSKKGCRTVSPLELETIALSSCQVEYPLINEMHQASSLNTGGEVIDWRRPAAFGDGATAGIDSATAGVDSASAGAYPLVATLVERSDESGVPSEAIEKVIERRASTRRFARKPISLADLSLIIEASTGAGAADVPLSTNSVYLIANDVQGLDPGGYYFNRNARALELVKQGSFRKEAAYLTLGQDLGGDAGVTFFLMADLTRVFNAFGNRGYRVAQIESGIIGGRMYLTAYALGRGATGLTFYDDDVTEFFSPHAAGKSCMLVVSVGVPGKRPIY